MKNIPYRLIIMMTVLSFLLISCSLLGNTNQPMAVSTPMMTLSNPVAGAKLAVGREVKIQSTSIAPEGIAKVELLINGELVRVDGNANPQSNLPFIVAQPWTPQASGSYIIQVKSYNLKNGANQASLTVEVVAITSDEKGITPTPQPPTVTPIPLADSMVLPQSSPTGSPVPTQSSTATQTPIILKLPLPTATPTVGHFKDTGLRPEGRFKDIWEVVDGGKGRLGYPTAAEIIDRNFAKQRFQQGEMYWWDNPAGTAYIWVVNSYTENTNNGLSWNRYPDSWASKDAYSCQEARVNGDNGPVRGFGKLWCDHLELQAQLGLPIERESGSGGNPPYSQVQFYQGGVMFYDPIHQNVLVLFNQGDWQRFRY